MGGPGILLIIYPFCHTPTLQTQLKDYDKDILQELWKIRNTVQTLREADKITRKEESKFLEESVEDISPTPRARQPEDFSPNSSTSPSSLSPSPSPSPAPAVPVQLDYLGVDGNLYTEGTLNRMANAPSHLRKSSDDLVLEEFFGTEQLTKLDMFKKQISFDNLVIPDRDGLGGGEGGLKQIVEGEEGLRPGISMPNISTPPLSTHNKTPPLDTCRTPPLRFDAGKVKLRLDTTCLLDANRMSCDVASEMEKLRLRLQETTKQELEEFDRKYSPKLSPFELLPLGSGGVGGGGGNNNHSRQSSLDSSIPQHMTTPPSRPLIMGHTRQLSLPIDPNFLKRLQSNEGTTTIASNLITHSKSGWSPSLGTVGGVGGDNGRSPTPPLLYGHVRQISAGSMSSDGTFSPPLTTNLTEGHTQIPRTGTGSSFPSGAPRMMTGGGGAGAGALPTQHIKASKPPGMARLGSDGGSSLNSTNQHTQGQGSRTSLDSGEGGNIRPPSGNVQPHYSTAVLKRGSGSGAGGKRSSLEIVTTHPQQVGKGPLYEKAPNGRPVSGSGLGGKRSSLDIVTHPQQVGKGPPNGRPGYEQYKLQGRSHGEDVVDMDTRRVNNGGMGRYSNLRSEGKVAVSSSPKLGRMVPDRRTTMEAAPPPKSLPRTSDPQYRNGAPGVGGAGGGGSSLEQDIEPYMTSSHVKAQMQKLDFNYVPFSHHQQQHTRSYAVSVGDAPRMGKQPNSAKPTGKNTWI